MVLKPPKVEVGKMSFDPWFYDPIIYLVDKGHNPINILENGGFFL